MPRSRPSPTATSAQVTRNDQRPTLGSTRCCLLLDQWSFPPFEKRPSRGILHHVETALARPSFYTAFASQPLLNRELTLSERMHPQKNRAILFLFLLCRFLAHKAHRAHGLPRAWSSRRRERWRWDEFCAAAYCPCPNHLPERAWMLFNHVAART